MISDEEADRTAEDLDDPEDRARKEQLKAQKKQEEVQERGKLSYMQHRAWKGDNARTINDVVQEAREAREDCNRSSWLQYGPMSIPWCRAHRDDPQVKELMDAWQKDRRRYKRLLEDQGLITKRGADA